MGFWVQLADALGADRYSQHAICLTNDPVIVFLSVSADLVTAGSYFAIGLSLLYHRTRTVEFSALARGLYGAFIFLCGLSHASEVLTMFSGVYRLDVAISAAMAIVSALTAVLTLGEARGTSLSESET
ncbi:hypothetical protein [Bradyrhizobium sp. Leo121]|uniref:hypothetical protein n=1 Tax=Bradyrhizobium sp. Leo121 TaxID=1571195 RepID=UPI001028A151|nr:hypothetical protein [Bradyrhizobium sp. Leo121]RZN13910.1 hypothetical protein CWO90_43975 [Bradyrhizobium sp. Leo121]